MLRVPQLVALFQKLLAHLADVLPVLMQGAPCIPVNPLQLAPLAGMAALHRPRDLVQMRVLLLLPGLGENRPQMIVAGRPVEFEHRARRPGMVDEFALPTSGVVADALRAIDLAALAFLSFRPLGEFQLGIRQGGGLAGDRMHPVDDDVNVGLRLVSVAEDDGLLETLRLEA